MRARGARTVPGSWWPREKTTWPAQIRSWPPSGIRQRTAHLPRMTSRPTATGASGGSARWGHEYPASVGSRNSMGSGCPYCTSRKVLRGFNDLATVEPKVAKEWAQDMNGLLTPSMVTTGSHKRVWWRCAEGHVWRAVIFTRARGKFVGCPVCSGRAKRKNVQPFTYAAPPGARLTHEEEKRL